MRAALHGSVATVALLLHLASQAAINVTDDSGRRITLHRPAARIVSLAPHATELLYAAGAGGQLAGVSAASDYPPEATRLPSVGNSMQLDIERIIALKPDLIVAWQSGNRASQVARLRRLGFVVFDSEPRTLDDIPRTLERLGELAGSARGDVAASAFRERLQALRNRFGSRPPLKVFYQIWPSPLMTLNDRHIVSDALRLCGAVNVFGKLKPLAPVISREAVVAARPEAILASDERGDNLARWRTLAQLPAARSGNLFRVDGALLNRAGPRMLDATEALCELVDKAREQQDELR